MEVLIKLWSCGIKLLFQIGITYNAKVYPLIALEAEPQKKRSLVGSAFVRLFNRKNKGIDRLVTTMNFHFHILVVFL